MHGYLDRHLYRQFSCRGFGFSIVGAQLSIICWGWFRQARRKGATISSFLAEALVDRRSSVKTQLPTIFWLCFPQARYKGAAVGNWQRLW